jgi:hypothetical protein
VIVVVEAAGPHVHPELRRLRRRSRRSDFYRPLTTGPWQRGKSNQYAEAGFKKTLSVSLLALLSEKTLNRGVGR